MSNLEHVRTAVLDELIEIAVTSYCADQLAYLAQRLAEEAGMKLYEEKYEQPKGRVADYYRGKRERRYIHGPTDLTHPRAADPPGFGA